MHKVSIKAGGKDCVGKDFWGDENLIHWDWELIKQLAQDCLENWDMKESWTWDPGMLSL